MVQILPLDPPYTSVHPWEWVQVRGLLPPPEWCWSLQLVTHRLRNTILNLHIRQSDFAPFATLASVVLTSLGPHSSPHSHPPWKHFTSNPTAALKSSYLQYFFLCLRDIRWAGALPVLSPGQEPHWAWVLLGRNPSSLTHPENGRNMCNHFRVYPEGYLAEMSRRVLTWVPLKASKVSK